MHTISVWTVRFHQIPLPQTGSIAPVPVHFMEYRPAQGHANLVGWHLRQTCPGASYSMDPGGEASELSGACYSFFTFTSFGNCCGIPRASAANPSPSANGTRSHQCLMELKERRPNYIDGTRAHAYPPLKAWPYGEWWMPAVSTDISTSSGVASCWSFQFPNTWNQAHQVPLARNAGWIYARTQIF